MFAGQGQAVAPVGNDDAKRLRVVIIGFSKDDDIPLFYNDTFRLEKL